MSCPERHIFPVGRRYPGRRDVCPGISVRPDRKDRSTWDTDCHIKKASSVQGYLRIVFSFFARLRSVFVSINHRRLSRKVERPSSVNWK